MHKSVERTVLRMAARACLDGDTSREASAIRARPVDWGWVLRQAAQENLGALLHAARLPLPVPASVVDGFRAAWVRGQRRYLLGAQQLSRIIAGFEREGVPVIPLRGPALGELLYRDPGVRPFTDLDLFIREADLIRSLGLLSALGYRHMEDGPPLSHELTWRHAASFVGGGPDEFPLDLHWGLVDYPGIAPAAAINHQELWDRAERVEGAGEGRLGLCPEDLLIALALHWAIHHALSGHVWQLDLALLISRHAGALDWEAVAERAERWHLRGALGSALREVRERLDAAVPPRVLARLRPAGPRRAVLDWLCHRGADRLERLDSLLPYLMMDKGSDVLRALASGALPPAGWLRCRYGVESALAGYLAHCARIGSLFARTLGASVEGTE